MSFVAQLQLAAGDAGAGPGLPPARYHHPGMERLLALEHQDMARRRPAKDATWFVRGRLKMRQLLLLVALDEHRNIHRAAEEVCITQPSASKQILELEATLGVKLFERLSTGMVPTIFGMTMIRHARSAMNILTMAHSDVMAMRSGLVGQVDIGTITTSVMSILPRAIAQVKQQAPTLGIGIHVDSSSVLLDRLRAGTLDFMIGRLGDDAQGLVYEEFAEEGVCVVARNGHRLLSHPCLRLADLAGAAWILPPQSAVLRTRFDWTFRRAGLTPPLNVVESNSVPFVLSLLEQTDALHVMPVEMANYYAALGVLAMLPVALDCDMDTFGLIYRGCGPLAPGAQALVDVLRKLAREDGWMGAPRAGAALADTALAATAPGMGR